MYEIVKALTERPGPLGREREFNTWLIERWLGLRSLHYEIIPPGTLLVRVGGSGRKLLLVAHSDEIGFCVKSVLDRGLITIHPATHDTNGRPSRRRGLHIAGQPALVLAENGSVEGIFTTYTGHHCTYEQTNQTEIRWRDFWVDVGCESRRECEALGILPGTPIIWNPSTRRLGEHRIVGKAMDDRAGLAVLEKLLMGVDPAALDCELWLAATASEECFASGARALSLARSFDMVVAVDVGLSSDCPAVSPEDVPMKMGDGAILVVKDNMTHYDICLLRAMERCAREHGLISTRASYGVDGSYTSDGLRFVERGTATALVAFPAAYTHCPYEIVDERDLLALCTLLEGFVQGLSKYYD